MRYEIAIRFGPSDLWRFQPLIRLDEVYKLVKYEAPFWHSLWSPPVVTRKEGVNSDKLHFGVSRIATWRVEMPHLQIHKMQNRESALCISAWSQSVVTPSKSSREEYMQTNFLSAFRGLRLGKSRNFTTELMKRRNVKS
jgi:hypothetical protein